MYLIAGLGNPGRQYEGTRHNVGFAALLTLADEYGIRVGTEKGKALTGSGIIGGEKVLLALPQTYMNLSGESIRALSDYFHIEPDHILIFCDDINLEPGRLRLRAKGSAGGHNGLKNIIQHLGTQDFARVRIGVGEKPEKMDLADYVLGHFGEEEKSLMREAQKEAAAAAVCFVEEGIDKAMNRFNKGKEKKKEQKAPEEKGATEKSSAEKKPQAAPVTGRSGSKTDGTDTAKAGTMKIGDIITQLFADRHKNDGRE